METSDILTIIQIIVLVLSMIVLALSIIISTYFVIQKINKSRNLETIKYISMVRKEMWELMDYKEMKTFKKEEETNGKEKIRALKQKLEYMAAAINNDDLSVKLAKRFCGRWFQSAVRILEIGDYKREESEEESYDEIKRLYNKLDELYDVN